jgi:polyisoprenoid-binding protein YceI
MLLLVCCLLCLLGAPRASAQPDAQADRIPLIEAEIYNIDRIHSALQFSIQFFGMSTVKGVFNEYEATLLYDDRDVTRTSVSLLIDAKTIDTDFESRDEDLRSERFLHTEQYPTIAFQSTRVETHGDAYVLFGDLTLRGVTHPVALPFRHTLKRTLDPGWGNAWIGFTGHTTVKRSDFGITGGDFWGVQVLSDEVRIDFEILGRISNLEKFSYRENEKPSAGAVLEKAIHEDGLQAALARYRALKHDAPEAYTFAPRELWLVAARLLQRRRLDEAFEVGRLLVAEHPESALAHATMGELYLRRGERAQALAAYEQCLALEPDHLAAHEVVRRLKHL